MAWMVLCILGDIALFPFCYYFIKFCLLGSLSIRCQDGVRTAKVLLGNKTCERKGEETGMFWSVIIQDVVLTKSQPAWTGTWNSRFQTNDIPLELSCAEQKRPDS